MNKKKLIKWNLFSEKKPKLNEEYVCAIDLDDEYDSLVVFACVYSIKDDKWYWANTDDEVNTVVYWRNKPKAPEYKKIRPIKTIQPTSIDQMERLAYGQCVHGENLAGCEICNPNPIYNPNH